MLALLTRCLFCLQLTINPSVNLHVKYSPSNQINPHTDGPNHSFTHPSLCLPSRLFVHHSVFITIQNRNKMWHRGLALQHRCSLIRKIFTLATHFPIKFFYLSLAMCVFVRDWVRYLQRCGFFYCKLFLTNLRTFNMESKVTRIH